MGKLNEKSWDAFELDSMFTFERGKEKNMASLIQGCIPLVSARKINNGIKGFVDNPKKVVKGGNVISLNNDGDGGAGLAYYQPADFALDTHVTALYPKKDVLSNILIYMTASISKQHAILDTGVLSHYHALTVFKLCFRLMIWASLTTTTWRSTPLK